MKNQDNQSTESLGKTADLYPQKLLNARTTALLVTIPHTKINYEELHNKIINKKEKNINYLITKLETHEDGDYHIHLVVKTNQQIRISAIHNIILSFNEDRTGNSTIDYQKPDNINATIQYLKKEDTAVEGSPYLEYGELPKERGRPIKQPNHDNVIDIIKLAEQGNTEEALEQLKHIDPMKYLQYKETFKTNLQSENKVRQKYSLPDLSPDNIKLTPNQQLVWDLLQSTPKQRRIIWITGDYGSGKSFLYNYIKTNHSYGMYDAGQTASLDGLAYGYDEEGVIAWDLPRTFNFQELGNPIANVIEKFSDFGQSITSKKYNGKTQHVRGHAIVFSNTDPLDQLQHRDIIHIDLTKGDMRKPIIKAINPIKADDNMEASASKLDEPINQIFYEDHRGKKTFQVNSNSDSDEELVIFNQPTNNPNIIKVIRGDTHIFKLTYKTVINGKTFTKKFNSEAEAQEHENNHYPSINY
jgi:hypothetical protein